MDSQHRPNLIFYGMTILEVENILGKTVYSHILLEGDERSSYQLTNILKVDINKFKMMYVDDLTKIAFLKKSSNLEVLSVNFLFLFGNLVDDMKICDYKNLKVLIIDKIPVTPHDLHKSFLLKFINNLPETMETIVISIKSRFPQDDWTTHFTYMNNLPFGLKYLVIFLFTRKINFMKENL